MFRNLFKAKVYLSLVVAVLGPFLPALQASVKRSTHDVVQNEKTMNKFHRDDISLASHGNPKIDISQFRDLNLNIEVLTVHGPLQATDVNRVIRFLEALDQLSLRYTLSPEVVELREKLAKRVGYDRPLCGALVVGGGIGILVVGTLVVLFVISVGNNMNGGGGGDINALRFAIEQKIRDAYDKIKVLKDLLEACPDEAAETIADVQAMIDALWNEIDDLLQQLWDLLHPGDGRFVAVLMALEVSIPDPESFLQ